MRFNCGPTEDEKQALRIAKKAKQIRDSIKDVGVWKPWFAWYPVRVASRDCRWLEWVERSRYADPTFVALVKRFLDGDKYIHYYDRDWLLDVEARVYERGVRYCPEWDYQYRAKEE
jgi:hypothetical protein